MANSFNDLLMPPSQLMNGMNAAPNIGALYGAQPTPQVQPFQPSPQLDHANDVLNQLIQTRQTQQDNSGLIQQILSQRFQPQMQDAARSISQTQQAYGAPELFKPITTQQAANERVGAELAPYTTGLDLAGKQGALQKTQIENEYAPQMEQAKIQALKAQSGFMNGAGTALSGATGQVQGDDYLKTLPPQIATQVKALAEGRMQFPGGFALKSPYWQQMVSAVSQYDPNFDAVNYNARATTRKDFTSGKSSQSINALNTVIGHMKVLSDAADQLNNSSVPMWNTVANYSEKAMGDPRMQQFDATKKAVVDELTRVYRGSGGSEGDIKTWSDQINSSGSPAQLHGVIAQIGDLLESKVNALGEQYNQGMGTTAKPIRLTTPTAQSALETLRKRAGSGQPSSDLKNMSNDDVLKALGL